ncbi:MAG: flagellar export protein FliJ [Syntrophomonadaceae bacterium]|nr:flagellar export protein FliJ [Syntrophomonadaceae bacterium]MDH7497011.1 flagellar export protein FliJ [Syntrophomonadaceae bacterium]
MKRFEFGLQTKLDVTVTREDQARQELALRRAQLDSEQRRLQALEGEREQCYQRLRQGQQEVLQLDELALVKSYLPRLKERIAAQAERVRRADNEVQAAQERLQELMQERKALEKLRDKEYAEYQQEVLRQEQLVIDEVAITGYWRSSRTD